MQRRYERTGMLALQPQAFFGMFAEVPDRKNEVVGNAAIVTIRGPLDQHAGTWCDSYEEILERVDAACKSAASTVVLKVDSPGGLLSGFLDTARTIRARCDAAGKRLVAYVDGQACSAGYGIACVAHEVIANRTALLGSIGILCTRVDTTAQDAAFGMRYTLVASGARKADSNPHTTLSDEELATLQAQCNGVAELFFTHVAEHRRLDVDAIRALEAGSFHGAQAIQAGLADRIASFDEVLVALASGGAVMAEENNEKKEEKRTAGPVDDARAALELAAEGEGEEAERARKALAVLNGEADAEEDEEGEEPEGEARRASAPSKSTTTTTTVSAKAAGGLAATVQALSAEVAEMRAEREASAKSALFAARPDLAKELVAKLQTMPLADARAIVEALPKPPAPNPAASAVVPGTRGEAQGGGAPSSSSPQAQWLDQQMGLAPAVGGVRREGHSMVFSPPPRPNQPAAPGAGKGAK